MYKSATIALRKENDLNYITENWKAIVQPYQKPNQKLAFVQILTSFIPFFGIWALMYYSMQVSYLLTLFLAFVNAFFLVRIFIIQHDCGHQSYLASKKWNDGIGFVCSLFSAIPYKYWAKSHNFHHGHNGRLEEDIRDIGDVSLLTVNEFKALTPWQQLRYRIYRMPIVLFVFGSLYYILLHNRLPLINKDSFKAARKSLVWSNIAIVVTYIALIAIFGWQTILKIQLPILAFFGIIAVWFFYVQHQHEYSYKQWKKDWNYVLSAIKGSTYYKLPKMFQWLTGNIGIHHIHHLSSLIPNYNLQRCKDENPILQKYVTQVTFFESLKYISHKLWDEDNQKMISFNKFYKQYGKNQQQQS
ncbi:MAG: fatty acid desaturase [Saprospiraceae bacterium]|nr:fatty acid desaturase [Saprospiraceae bacterium]MBP7699284.1 fatty acid desaturase [Saprospiraceae bacterium]